jgi:ankyrin repeat protein
VSFIRTFLTAGADINAVDETGKTALTDAIQMNRAEAVRVLLEKGASPVMQDMYGRNAFHEAVEHADAQTIALLRTAGGNPMARDSWGKTPLSLALKKSGETVMAVLGTNTNVVDSDGNTPLHAAVAEKAGEETFLALLRARFPVNNRNRTGSTALLLAVRAGDERAARILLKSGADPYAADNAGDSPLSIAITSSQGLLETLAETAVDRTDTIGDGMLHYAARIADEKTMERILTLPRVDRDARNVAGERAYDVAVRWQRPNIAALLK